MLFIKNLTTSSAKFGVRVEQTDNQVVIYLVTPDGGCVSLLASTESAIAQSIRRSIDYVGRKTQTLLKASDGKSVESELFTDKATEIAFYVKGEKISLEQNVPNGRSQAAGSAMNINVVREEEGSENKDKRKYPRDVIAIICDKDAEEDVATVRYDKRNVTGNPIYVLVGDEYQVILIVPKWPIWTDLKFPVYFCVTRDGERRDVPINVGAIKLDSRQENGVTKNQISEVDFEEASTYLTESQRLYEEQQMQAGVNKLNRKNNSISAKPQRTTKPEYSENRQERRNHAPGNNKKPGDKNGGNPGRKGNPSVKFPVHGNGKSSSAPRGNNGKNYRSQGRGN